MLQANETVQAAAGIPQIVYYREGSQSEPLAVFIPGGGHLARVSYGHSGAQREHFLDAWLEKAGYGLLALSYPSDHQAFTERLPQLTVIQWAASIAELIQTYVQQREIILLGWSSAGRSVVAIERALRQRGLALTCFVSLAATAPLPNLLPTRAAPEHFTAEGFWDSSTRHAEWLSQVGTAIDERSYLEHYVVNSPYTLRAQSSLGDDISAFNYSDYPPIAAIIPEDREDPLHATTDAAVWGTLNVLRLAQHRPRPDSWEPYRDLLRHIPQRMSRTVGGGHFFFIGAAGAMTTVRHIIELTNEAAALRREVHALCEPLAALGPAPPRK